jgi:hypothetical protein
MLFFFTCSSTSCLRRCSPHPVLDGVGCGINTATLPEVLLQLPGGLDE